MVLLLIFSIILILFHVSSLRLIIRLGRSGQEISQVEDLEVMLPSEDDRPRVSMAPAVVIIFLSLLEIAYFVASAYIFQDIIITAGAAILTGYSIYSLIKFLPDFKALQSKPSKYLQEKDYKMDNVINFSMILIEIVFCFYVIFKVLSRYGLLG